MDEPKRLIIWNGGNTFCIPLLLSEEARHFAYFASYIKAPNKTFHARSLF
jgi:hypothetical protein